MRSTTFNNEKSFTTGEEFFESYGNPHPPQKEEPQEYFIGDIYDRYDGLRDGRWPEPNIDDGHVVFINVCHISDSLQTLCSQG